MVHFAMILFVTCHHLTSHFAVLVLLAAFPFALFRLLALVAIMTAVMMLGKNRAGGS
jgi:hypothetical protein